jgi:hypothetical protein
MVILEVQGWNWVLDNSWKDQDDYYAQIESFASWFSQSSTVVEMYLTSVIQKNLLKVWNCVVRSLTHLHRRTIVNSAPLVRVGLPSAKKTWPGRLRLLPQLSFKKKVPSHPARKPPNPRPHPYMVAFSLPKWELSRWTPKCFGMGMDEGIFLT